MNKVIVLLALFLFSYCFVSAASSQTPKDPPPTPAQATPQAAPFATPVLDTAEMVALQTLEGQKKTAVDQYNQASKTESDIVGQFAGSHPGWRLDPHTFAVERDAAPVATKPGARVPEPKPAGPTKRP